MKLLLWNTKGPGSKVKSPINKEEITFTCCQGLVLQKDWCSHIKSALWKVLLKLYECQLYRWFFSFSIMFHFQSMFSGIIKVLIWGFFFVCWLGHFFKKLFFLRMFCTFFFLSCSPSVFVLTATGFVDHFLLSAPSFRNAGLSSDRHWSKKMRNDLNSLAPLHLHLPYYYKTHEHFTHTCTHMHTCMHTHTQICALYTSLHRWLVKSPQQKRHLNL